MKSSYSVVGCWFQRTLEAKIHDSIEGKTFFNWTFRKFLYIISPWCCNKRDSYSTKLGKIIFLAIILLWSCFQPKERSTLCRAATNKCDLPEYCNGRTEECPADFYVQDGVLCPGRDNVTYLFKTFLKRFFSLFFTKLVKTFLYFRN